MSDRTQIGHVGQSVVDEPFSYLTTAEAQKWDNEDVLVQLVQVHSFVATFTNGYQVSKTDKEGNNPQLVLTTSDEEEAAQMWLSEAFGM